MHCLQVCILYPNVQTVDLVLFHLDLTSTAWFSFVPHHQCVYRVYALLLGLMQTNSHFWILHSTVLSKWYSDCVIHHCESNQFQGSFLKVATVNLDVFAVLFEISIVHQVFCIIKSICAIWSLDWVLNCYALLMYLLLAPCILVSQINKLKKRFSTSIYWTPLQKHCINHQRKACPYSSLVHR